MRKSKYCRGKSRCHRWDATQIGQKTTNRMLRLSEQTPRTQLAPSDPKHLHSPNPHSHSRSTKPNPAISRLSASQTPGNAPHHSNAPRGVRETCTNLCLGDTRGIRCYGRGANIRCGSSERLLSGTSGHLPRLQGNGLSEIGSRFSSAGCLVPLGCQAQGPVCNFSISAWRLISHRRKSATKMGDRRISQSDGDIGDAGIGFA